MGGGVECSGEGGTGSGVLVVVGAVAFMGAAEGGGDVVGFGPDEAFVDGGCGAFDSEEDEGGGGGCWGDAGGGEEEEEG